VSDILQKGFFRGSTPLLLSVVLCLVLVDSFLHLLEIQRATPVVWIKGSETICALEEG